MPDLSRKGVHAFWSEYNDSSVYRVISFMEGVEGWTLDGDAKVEEAIKTLSDELENIGNFDLASQAEIIKVTAFLTSGRILRLLQTLDSANPGAASKVLVHSEESSRNQSDPPGLFLKRNIAFERLRLLGRVFSKERFALLIKALEGEEQD